jgi:hypothetical protein
MYPFDQQIRPVDWTVLQRLADDVFMGRAFVFVGSDALSRPGLSWDAPADRPRVLSLLGPEPVELPGVHIGPTVFPPFHLTSITSDKSLYREGRDVVHLLVLSPLTPDRETALEVRANGAEFARRPVRLDRHGAASIALRDLPAGEYEVRFSDAPPDVPASAFTVAEYRLAPLVASLVDRRLEGQPQRLTLRLRLESFGVPVEGAVRLELAEGGRRIAETRAVADDGLVETAFTLEGEGPHAVNVQFEADPSRTASVPLVGSRAAERSATVLSTLGSEVTGSLLPGPASRPVRGIFLDEGAERSTPFRLERVDAQRARLVARGAAESVRVVLLRPHAAEAQPEEVARDAVAPGEVVELDVPAPMALLAVGAYVDGKPWEGWAALLRPEELAPRVHVPERCAPGSEIDIEIETGGQDGTADVYVIVKDARLLSADTPGNRLAGCLKTFVETAGKGLAVGPVRQPLADRLRPPRWSGVLYRLASDATLMTMLAQPESLLAANLAGTRATSIDLEALDFATCSAGAAFVEETTALAVAEAPAGSAQPERRQPARDEPEVVFAGLLTATDGRVRAPVRLGAAFADYVVEAFVLRGLDWAAAEARFQAARDPFVSLDVPAFVHPDDSAVGRIQAGAASGRMRVRLTRDGVDVPLFYDGRPLASGAPVVATRAEIIFLACPGEYEAVLEDSDGVDHAVKRVDVPGKLRTIARTLRFLEPGQRVCRANHPAIRDVRVLPGLEKPFRVLVEATADYGHACCEQTAAKILAACAMYVFAGDDAERRGRAEAIISAGVRREGLMWLRGRGFKMYPESADEPNGYYGPKAARYLRNLALLREAGGPPSPALAEVIDSGMAMADDAGRAYGLPWPPRTDATCEEAYAVVRFGDAAGPRERALAFIRDYATRATGPGLPPDGAVGQRSESAYAAAALFRAGDNPDRARALLLANAVVKDLGPEGRLYSTLDSVAAIALMIELQAAGLVGGPGVVEIDGRRLAISAASELPGRIDSIAAAEGVAVVEVVRTVEESWDAFASQVPLRVALERNGQASRHFTAGEAMELCVKLETGYRAGDLLWVCLPDALTRVLGGGQVKRFAVDFAGRDEVRVPLAATGVTVDRQGDPAPQHFAVCVRNMFEEERTGNPGLIDVTVVPGNGQPSVPGRRGDAVRGLLSQT